MVEMAIDTNTIEEYLKKPYARILTPDEDGNFVAEILEFEGCYAEGKTQVRALKNLEKVARSWIETRLEENLFIPEPFAYFEMSGRFALRLPQSLHTKAAIMAERDGVSLNTFIVNAVAATVGAQDLFGRLLQKWETLRPTFVNNFYVNMDSKGTGGGVITASR